MRLADTPRKKVIMAEFKNMVEKFDAVIAILEGADSAFTRDEAIAFLRDRAEKAKTKPRAAKANPELDEFRKALATWLMDQTEPVTAGQAAEAMSVPGATCKEDGKVSVQKASHGLKFLAETGCAEVIEPEKRKGALTYRALFTEVQ